MTLDSIPKQRCKVCMLDTLSPAYVLPFRTQSLTLGGYVCHHIDAPVCIVGMTRVTTYDKARRYENARYNNHDRHQCNEVLHMRLCTCPRVKYNSMRLVRYCS